MAHSIKRPVLCVAHLFAAALAIPAAVQAQQPFSFKGVPLGASEQQLRERFSAFECDDDADRLLRDRLCIASSQSCAGRGAREPMCQTHLQELLTYGGAEASLVTVGFYAGKLSRVDLTINVSDYTRVVAAITEAYGKATTTRTETIQNRMGARFENSIFEWKRAGSTIRTVQRTSIVDKGSVSVYFDSAVTEYSRRSKDRRKADAKSL